MILKLYAARLHLIRCNLSVEEEGGYSSSGAKFKLLVGKLLENDILKTLEEALSGPLTVSSNVQIKEFDEDVAKQMSTLLGSEALLSLYISALEEFSQPLVALIHEMSDEEVAAEPQEHGAFITFLSTVLDVFHRFCNLVCTR